MEQSIEHLVQLTKETLILTMEEIFGTDATPLVAKLRGCEDSPEGLHRVISQCEVEIKPTISTEKYQQMKVICSALLKDLDEAAQANARPAVTDEKRALKLRIVKAKLIAVTSGVLGAEGLNVLQKLRSAPETREGLIAALKECESIASKSVNAAKADEFRTTCQKIINQLTA